MKKIRIRPVDPKDAQPAYEAVRESLAEVSPWISSLQPSLTLAGIETWIENTQRSREEGSGYAFAIVDPEEDIFLGGCNLSGMNKNYYFANLSYWVRTSQTRQGLASQAVQQAAKFGFQEAGLLRVEIVVAEPNIASQRVAEKAGAVREGLLRNRITVHDQTYNAWMYSLIPADFE